MNIYPMRRYSANFAEYMLGNWGKYLSVFIILSTIPMFCIPSWFKLDNFWGGLLTLGTLVSALLLNLATGAVRQNYPVLHLGKIWIFTVAIGWLIYAVVGGVWLFSLLGVFMLIVYYLVRRIHYISVHARFAPRFFSLSQFKIMLQITDALMPEDSELNFVELSLQVDHNLYKAHTREMRKDIKRTLWIIQWFVPITSLRFFPFTSLGTHERRRLLNKSRSPRGRFSPYKLPIFHDVAKTIQILMTASDNTLSDGQVVTVNFSTGHNEEVEK